MNHLKSLIREVPNFPKPGINFFDITTLLKDPVGLQSVLDALKSRYAGASIDQVIGIEARGFFFAPAVAYAIGAGFVPVRKPKKLPAPVERVEYALEYGTDTLEIHKDAILPGQRVLIVDDVLPPVAPPPPSPNSSPAWEAPSPDSPSSSNSIS